MIPREKIERKIEKLEAQVEILKEILRESEVENSQEKEFRTLDDYFNERKIIKDKDEKIQKIQLKKEEKLAIKKEKIKNKMLEWVKLQGGRDGLSCGYTTTSAPEQKEKVKKLLKYIGCSKSTVFRELREELVKEGKLEKLVEAKNKLVYKIPGEETVGQYVKELIKDIPGKKIPVMTQIKMQKFQERKQRYPELCEKILSFIKSRGGKSTFRYTVLSRSVSAKISEDAIREFEEIQEHCGKEWIYKDYRECFDTLISSGKLKKTNLGNTSSGGRSYLYEIFEKEEDKKLKKQAAKVAREEKKLQKKLKEFAFDRDSECKLRPGELCRDCKECYLPSSLEREEDAEDDELDRPFLSFRSKVGIPELQKDRKRQIKDQCPRCHNNLIRENTEVNGMDPLVDSQDVISCWFCGEEIYPEVGKEAD